MKMSPLIIALDFASADEALNLAKRLPPEQCRVKVGKELFTAGGPHIVEELQKLGFEVFLDLKFHDIPNTVGRAVSAACKLGVWMLSIHALGGNKMLDAACDAVLRAQNSPLLVAVTILTSMQDDDLVALGFHHCLADEVQLLAGMARDAGFDGVVCSAREARMLRNAFGKDFVLVTPGIRLPDDELNDQQRVITPSGALQLGSDYLVVGRPVTRSQNPSADVQRILQEIEHDHEPSSN